MVESSAEWKEDLSSLNFQTASENPEIFLRSLKNLVVNSLNQDVRQAFQSQHVKFLMEVASQKMKRLNSSPVYFDETIIPTLKLLRNLCAGVESNQRLIGEESFICSIADSAKLLCFWNNDDIHKSDMSLLVKICVQLLGNCCVNNDVIQGIVWSLGYDSLFRLLLSNENPGVVECLCMVIYTCVKGHSKRKENLLKVIITNEELPSTCDGYSLFSMLVTLPIATNCEWIKFIVDDVLKEYSLGVLFDSSPDASSKVALLGQVFDFDSKIPEVHIDFVVVLFDELVPRFIQECSQLSMLDEACFDKDSMSFMKVLISILDILCLCSSQLKYLELLQLKPFLMKNAIDFLSVLSQFDGSSSSACNISKLSQNKSNVTTPIILHGVKRNLVQLIGNLCYQCRIHQDYMNDHIPLLLNQCAIDSLNPYITQWSVWAIRNTTENHPLNQNVIAQLEKRDLENMKELERNYGCEVGIDINGKIKIKK